MKILVGTDIVEIGRFSKHVKFERNGKLPHFITRCYTPKEIEYCMGKKLDKARLESLAARFAAKEAVSKALGTGIMTKSIGFTDIEITNDEKGTPFVTLHNEAKSEAERLNVASIAISLSHDGDYAIAYCSMLAQTDGER